MKNFLLLILGLILIAFLSIICFNNKLEPIKEYVINITQNKLSESGIHGLDVDVVGEGYKTELATRISGIVLSDEKKEKALEVAESVKTVFYVQDEIKVEKPKVIRKKLVFEPVEIEKPKAPKPVVEDCQEELNTLLSKNKIEFKVSGSEIQDESFKLLDDIASVIKRCEEKVTKIEIAGFTDSSGSQKLNKQLSQDRAESVKVYLVGKNITDSILVAKGYGSQSPITSNDTAEGRAKNRRIEFRLKK